MRWPFHFSIALYFSVKHLIPTKRLSRLFCKPKPMLSIFNSPTEKEAPHFSFAEKIFPLSFPCINDSCLSDGDKSCTPNSGSHSLSNSKDPLKLATSPAMRLKGTILRSEITVRELEGRETGEGADEGETWDEETLWKNQTSQFILPTIIEK